LCWGAATGGGQHRRKVAAVKHSCKPAATPQGFPTSIQPRSVHPGLRRSNLTYSTTYHTQSTHKSVDLGEHPFFLHLQSDPTGSSILFETTRVIYRAHNRHLAHTGHTPPHKFQGDSGSFGGWGYGSMEEGIWTRENVVGKVFPCEDRGGRGITVAVASGVATWLHCGRSPPGI
jgi:hypothetical protein